MSDSHNEMDMRAAEYVLGLLDAGGARAVEEEARGNLALAQAITLWEARLSPLAECVPPVAPPPALWARLTRATKAQSARTRSVKSVLWQSLPLWRGATAGGFALAAAMAAIAFFVPHAEPQYRAMIMPISQPAAAWFAETQSDGTILLTMLSPAPHAANKDLELWGLPEGTTKPVPLGVMPESGRYKVAASNLNRRNLQLLVSLEPKGGSPTGLPTGPVLYGGTLLD